MKQAEFDLTGFANAVRNYRVDIDVSLREASKQLGIPASQLCRIENLKPTSVERVLTICEWMKQPISKFYKIKTIKNDKQP